MPKVTRKAAAADPLQDVPSTSGMEVEVARTAVAGAAAAEVAAAAGTSGAAAGAGAGGDSATLPPKPAFGALSAQEQAGNKVEFRRVRRRPRRVPPRRGEPMVSLSDGGAAGAPGRPPTALSAADAGGARLQARPAQAPTAPLLSPAPPPLPLHPPSRCSPPPPPRQIPVSQHRMTPLKAAWMQLYTPITEHLKLDMRMNLKTKKVGGGPSAIGGDGAGRALVRGRGDAGGALRGTAAAAAARGALARLLHPHTAERP